MIARELTGTIQKPAKKYLVVSVLFRASREKQRLSNRTILLHLELLTAHFFGINE